MHFLGLHLIDWMILAGYFVVMIGIGKWANKKIHDTTDFYQGGRRLGKVLNTFLWFGNITSADQSSGVARVDKGRQTLWRVRHGVYPYAGSPADVRSRRQACIRYGGRGYITRALGR